VANENEDNPATFRLADEARAHSKEPNPAADAVRRMCSDVAAPAAEIGHLAESIASDPTASPRARHLARMIVMQSDLVSEICASTLVVERSSRLVRLDQIVSECMWRVRSWFRGTIEERIDPVTVSAHRVSMLRLVTTLLTVACQATGPDGGVRIVLGHDGSLAHIEVATTGSRPEPPPSDALGDSDVLEWRIVSDIVADHHGRIRIDPAALGGTSVHIEIPLDATGDETTADN
jgi:hypothetical protein